MTEPSASVLARIDTRTEENFGQVVGGIGRVRTSQRVVQDGIRMILDRLTPAENEGPTLGEMLAWLIEVVGNADQRAKRILTWLEAMGADLPANIVLLLNEDRGHPVGWSGQA